MEKVKKKKKEDKSSRKKRKLQNKVAREAEEEIQRPGEVEKVFLSVCQGGTAHPATT